jgi:hypothetical protein
MKPRRAKPRRVLTMLLLAGLAACAPPPTPLPVIIEPTAAPTPSEMPDFRIVVDPLYAEYATYHGGFADGTAVTVVSDMGFWNGLPDSLNNTADAAFALGTDIAGGQPGTEITWAVRIDSEVVSLNLSAILRSAFSPDVDQAELRTRLANLGYPDGLTLTAAEIAPASAFMDAPLNAINLRIRRISAAYTELDTILENGQAQIALIALPTALLRETDLVVAARTIQYRAAPGIVINFTERGLPIVTVS